MVKKKKEKKQASVFGFQINETISGIRINVEDSLWSEAADSVPELTVERQN